MSFSLYKMQIQVANKIIIEAAKLTRNFLFFFSNGSLLPIPTSPRWVPELLQLCSAEIGLLMTLLTTKLSTRSHSKVAQIAEL